MRNGIFHVAKEEGSDEVLGVACWLRPQPAGQPPTWRDWFEDWRLWFNQASMNLWYGRGGLNVKVRRSIDHEEILPEGFTRKFPWPPELIFAGIIFAVYR